MPIIRDYLIQSILKLELRKMEGSARFLRLGREAVLLKVLRDSHDNDLVVRHSILMKELLNGN